MRTYRYTTTSLDDARLERTVTILFCSGDELAQLLRDRGTWRWYMALGIHPRGLAWHEAGRPWEWTVAVRRDARDLEGLLAHELGHVRGLEHTLLPTTMNEAWPLRLLDPDGLREQARSILDCPCHKEAPHG